MQRSDPPAGGVSDSPVRLVIADDHDATRTGLRLALGSLGFNVTAEAADADSAIRAVLRERPDQCLIATHLPGGGIRAAAEIHARAPEVAIVILDTAADEAALFAALDAGAAGYLLKDIEPRALGDALHGVQRGEAAIPRHLLSSVVAEFRARSLGGVPGQASRDARLSHRAPTARARAALHRGQHRRDRTPPGHRANHCAPPSLDDRGAAGCRWPRWGDRGLSRGARLPGGPEGVGPPGGVGDWGFGRRAG